MYICFPTSLVLKQSVLNVVVFSANLLLHLNFVALNCELQRQRVRPLWFRALQLKVLMNLQVGARELETAYAQLSIVCG